MLFSCVAPPNHACIRAHVRACTRTHTRHQALPSPASSGWDSSLYLPQVDQEEMGTLELTEFQKKAGHQRLRFVYYLLLLQPSQYYNHLVNVITHKKCPFIDSCF